ncbi:MAG: hypothetical protein IPO25_22220 [Saprospiraceae bacterium]|nr:hypothetical protein [Saprospiraceae bacterium]
MKNKFICLICSLMILTWSQAQTLAVPVTYELSYSQAIKNLPGSPSPHHKVLILGSPHFDLSNNASDWKPKTEVDMLGSKKQLEIEQIVLQLKAFNPTRICIEWLPEMDSLFQKRYQDYLKGTWQLKAGEYYQVGFRLAKMMDHKKLFCIDNKPKQPESLLEIDDWEQYKAQQSEASEMATYDSLNERFNQYVDSVQYLMSLKNYLQFVNSEEMKAARKRIWFTGLVHAGNKSTYAGADLTGHWYQRNTRIFSNIKKLCAEPEERILVIIGFGHASILEEMFKASQQFEVVPISSVLN